MNLKSLLRIERAPNLSWTFSLACTLNKSLYVHVAELTLPCKEDLEVQLCLLVLGKV